MWTKANAGGGNRESRTIAIGLHYIACCSVSLCFLHENERFVLKAPRVTGLPYPRTTPRIKYLMKRAFARRRAYRSLRPTACATSLGYPS